jgi:sigma-B regulation protein RsbU (phosphoserine phosphatase)
LSWLREGGALDASRRKSKGSRLGCHGALPLGMIPNVVYTDWELALQQGDILVFYTDGIIEAENEAGEMYETRRLEQLLTQVDSAMKAEEIMEAIFQDVADFAGAAEQHDDMTVIVIKKR